MVMPPRWQNRQIRRRLFIATLLVAIFLEHRSQNEADVTRCQGLEDVDAVFFVVDDDGNLLIHRCMASIFHTLDQLKQIIPKHMLSPPHFSVSDISPFLLTPSARDMVVSIWNRSSSTPC